MKDARGHGSTSRLGMGGSLDPNRPVIHVHQGPGQVFGHFMSGQRVDRSWAADQVGRGNARFETVPVRNEEHSEELRAKSGGKS
jgi:hypothetical protein